MSPTVNGECRPPEPAMKIRALAPWFGGARRMAEQIGPRMGRCRIAFVLFAGGLPELPYIQTQSGVATDLHRHIINLAQVVANDRLLVELIRRVDRLLYHPDVLAQAQARCLDREAGANGPGLFAAGGDDGIDVGWAADYFVCCWMGRGGYSGRGGELTQPLAVRYTASGGSSARRWRSAVESLPAWGRVLARWEFVRTSGLELAERLKPQEGAAVYADPPWVGAGDEYTHRFTTEQHQRLAREAARLAGCGYRVVLRYGDDPLIRGLYPAEEGWEWTEHTSLDQRNGEVAEVLIVKGGA